ncbi:MAG: radical SAM protein [Candidatus Latescibacterota bacterium]
MTTTLVQNIEIDHTVRSFRLAIATEAESAILPNSITIELHDRLLLTGTDNGIIEKTIKYTDYHFINLLMISQEQLYKEIDECSPEILRSLFFDRWYENYIVNLWEYRTGQSVLTSYPWNVAIPISDRCNAKCPFCNSWFRGERYLKPEELERFAPVLRYAKLFGLQGHGEPLYNPHIEEILGRLGAILDSRCRIYLITNGVFLQKYLDTLLKTRVEVYNISLNAATAATHHEIMQTGEKSLEMILSAIRKLVELRNSTHPSLEINISFVVIQQNIHEVADFIRLGNDLGVNSIQVRTLAPVQILTPDIGLNYHTLTPYLHPRFPEYVERAKTAIRESSVRVDASPDSWASPVFPPDLWEEITRNPHPVMTVEDIKNSPDTKPYLHMEGKALTKGEKIPGMVSEKAFSPNPYGRTPHCRCKYVYQDLILTDFTYRIYPCCYIFDIPGHEAMYYDGSFDFFEVWNSPAMVHVRESLRNGPMLGACQTCPPQEG